MAKEENKERVDPNLERLRQKTAKGALNVVEALFQEPRFRKLIRRTLLKQSLETSIFLALLIVGIFTVFNTLKTVYNFGWIGDLLFGVTLISIGLSYIIRGLFHG